MTLLYKYLNNSLIIGTICGNKNLIHCEFRIKHALDEALIELHEGSILEKLISTGIVEALPIIMKMS
jgi:hypothetical protein